MPVPVERLRLLFRVALSPAAPLAGRQLSLAIFQRRLRALDILQKPHLVLERRLVPFLRSCQFRYGLLLCFLFDRLCRKIRWDNNLPFFLLLTIHNSELVFGLCILILYHGTWRCLGRRWVLLQDYLLTQLGLLQVGLNYRLQNTFLGRLLKRLKIDVLDLDIGEVRLSP